MTAGCYIGCLSIAWEAGVADGAAEACFTMILQRADLPFANVAVT